MNKLVFIENQRFTQSWLWLLILGFMLFVAVVGKPIAVLITLGTCILFYMMYLKTEFRAKGIRYRFVPFHGKDRLIEWNEIEEYYIRQYNPIMEYGGWGIKFSHKGMVLNTKGNMGLQLILKNGRKILIGTQRADELDDFLRSLDIRNDLV